MLSLLFNVLSRLVIAFLCVPQYSFLPYSKMNQLCVYIRSLFSRSPPHLIPTEHCIGFPGRAAGSRQFCFIQSDGCMSVPGSPSSRLPFLPLVSTRLFSMSVSLFCKYVHLYHFSRFHIYVLIYDVFALFDFLHSVWCSLGPLILYSTCTC